MPDAASPPLHFDAMLTPHRSLGRTGFLVLMGMVSAVSFTAGVAFWMMGAWPILGFFGLDVLLIYLAFRVNYRAGRICETVQLSDEALVIRRYAADGSSSQVSFQPYWVRIGAPDPEHIGGQVTVGSHGRSVTVGSFLTPEEKAAFADALRAALDGRRAAAPL